MRRVNQHPWWCARGSLCTAHTRGGEHRSSPASFNTGACRLVATRIETAGGRCRVELRAVVELPDDPHEARHAASCAILGVLHALDPNYNPAGTS